MVIEADFPQHCPIGVWLRETKQDEGGNQATQLREHDHPDRLLDRPFPIEPLVSHREGL